MKRPSKPAIVLMSIPVVILLFFSSNIYGYFRFKHYCATEGGLKVYEKIERNVGWLAESRALAGNAAMIDGVLFGRYQDRRENIMYDVKYIGGDIRNESSYLFSVASDDKTIYTLNEYRIYLDENKRLKKISYLISNMVGVKIAEFNNIYYSAWGGNLGGPDWVSCDVAHNWKYSLENAFK